jgi:ubiquinone/menaquinone biosynthesis C-methylase UbiE
MQIGSESLAHYRARGISVYNRYPEMKQRFPSADCPEFERFIDTEGVLYYQELQEVAVPFPKWQDMATVGGETDLRQFLKIGYDCYLSILPPLKSLADGARLLDFGVGCGRTIRFFYRQCDQYELHGCDVDASSISYLKDRVPFIKAIATSNRPPLPYSANYFDAVYCISVFTHFTAVAFSEWLLEICRVLKPHATLALTLHGEHSFDLVERNPQHRKSIRIDEASYQQSRGCMASEGFVFAHQYVGSADIDEDRYGINFISMDMFVRATRSWFDLVSYEPERIGGWQDLAVLRKRS